MLSSAPTHTPLSPRALLSSHILPLAHSSPQHTHFSLSLQPPSAPMFSSAHTVLASCSGDPVLTEPLLTLQAGRAGCHPPAGHHKLYQTLSSPGAPSRGSLESRGGGVLGPPSSRGEAGTSGTSPHHRLADPPPPRGSIIPPSTCSSLVCPSLCLSTPLPSTCPLPSLSPSLWPCLCPGISLQYVPLVSLSTNIVIVTPCAHGHDRRQWAEPSVQAFAPHTRHTPFARNQRSLRPPLTKCCGPGMDPSHTLSCILGLRTRFAGRRMCAAPGPWRALSPRVVLPPATAPAVPQLGTHQRSLPSSQLQPCGPMRGCQRCRAGSRVPATQHRCAHSRWLQLCQTRLSQQRLGGGPGPGCVPFASPQLWSLWCLFHV